VSRGHLIFSVSFVIHSPPPSAGDGQLIDTGCFGPVARKYL
jgi:hypothetical protein